MRVVNFFGGPGAGKSTAASGLFHEMKRHWIEAEYVPEYAKELVWSDSTHMLSQQNKVFAEQEHRLHRLRGKVDVAISDSPLLLSSFYGPAAYPASFHQYVFDFFSFYDNINIVVRRSHHYALTGRLQGERDADRVAEEMERFLIQNGIPFWVMTAADSAPARLLDWLVRSNMVALPDELSAQRSELLSRPAQSAQDPCVSASGPTVSEAEGHFLGDRSPAPPALLPDETWITHVPAQRPWRSGDPIRLADLKGVKTVGPSPPASSAS
jgi:hypothetical protein